MSTITRETRETRVRVTLGLGGGDLKVTTGEPFLDHMLITFARYAGLGLVVEATGDLRHHLTEDVAITIGEALRHRSGNTLEVSAPSSEELNAILDRLRATGATRDWCVSHRIALARSDLGHGTHGAGVDRAAVDDRRAGAYAGQHAVVAQVDGSDVLRRR